LKLVRRQLSGSMGGCCTSKSTTAIKGIKEKDDKDRIEIIKETKSETFGGLKVRYAYMSQRGYYPDDLRKPNQDAFSIEKNFCGESSDAFFGVYDGHGQDGTECAQFARELLPSTISRLILQAKSIGSTFGKKDTDSSAQTNINGISDIQLRNACTSGHNICNAAMHRDSGFDSSLSGTTAVSCYIQGKSNRITICNVGDSRVVLGKQTSTDNSSGAKGSVAQMYKAIPLSSDQTPYRLDERKRIREAGGRVLTFDQIEGIEPINEDDDELGTLCNLGEELDEGGDPPRVWSTAGDYPGTAFTRSLGDKIAENFGVFSKPEILTQNLESRDKILVLASDGVYEFLTNQSVIDICAKFKDPLEACRAIVAESYELWLKYELRTDDITIICIFIDDVDEVAELKADGTDCLDSQAVDGPVRPVRTGVSKEKAKLLLDLKDDMKKVNSTEDNSKSGLDIMQFYKDKTSEEMSIIKNAVSASTNFQGITSDVLAMIYMAMEPVEVKKDDWVISQGTIGDRFYVVDHGEFNVLVVPKDAKDDLGHGGDLVHVYSGSNKTNVHPSFGEIALFHSTLRAASVIARTDGKLWALHGDVFRIIMAEKKKRQKLATLLSKEQELKQFDSEKLEKMVGAVQCHIYEKGDLIVNKGDVGHFIYVICHGTTETSVTKTNKAKYLKEDEMFGKEILLSKTSKYNKKVEATATSICWQLDTSLLK